MLWRAQQGNKVAAPPLIRQQQWLIFSNGVGQDEEEVRTGNAMILDPYGRILVETWQAADAKVSAELDFSLINRCTGQRWIRGRRPERYG